MAVKIVTDTLSDITDDLASKLGVTVVPLTVTFGHESFLDRVEITTDEFYRRLTQEDIFPTTTQPAPGVFVEVYEKLAQETDEILTITLSSKLSGTYQSAMNAKQIVGDKCRIEIIDSHRVAMSQGLLVIAAANIANSGACLDDVVTETIKRLPRSHLFAYFDTLKYLAKGGRIGKAQNLLGSMLSIKPILTMREGEMAPLTRVRSRSAGIDYLYDTAKSFPKLEGLAVEDCTTPDDGDKLADRLGELFPREKIIRSTISPVVGTHAGPDALAVSILEGGD